MLNALATATLTDTCQHYTQQLIYHAQAWACRQRLEQHAYQTLHALYNNETRQIRQLNILAPKTTKRGMGPRLVGDPPATST